MLPFHCCRTIHSSFLLLLELEQVRPPPPTLEIPEAISIQSSPTVPQGLGFPLMAGSRGNERKCPRRLSEDTALCLSDLPDEILLRIISFLPTKSAVATSLLSRRWKYLWTSTPNLQLHESWSVEGDQFMTFAERALLLRCGSSLVSFSFHLCWQRVEAVADYASRINTLITSAIRYNVEELDLEGSFILPFCLFECQSLVKLVLNRSPIRVASMICLPRLKHLALTCVEFADNESAEKLLSHLSLEELILCDCDWSNVKTVNVNSPKLQSLAIEDIDHEDWSEEQQLCFFGDNLKFFRYTGGIPPTQYSICGSTMQLREAEILVGYYNHKTLNMDGPSNRYCKLINSLSMVQNLTLSNFAFESFYRLSQRPLLQTTLPVFERVTRLYLKGGYDPETIGVDRVSLRMLFERCPHLEHLNFMKMIELDCVWKGTPFLRPVPSCFRTHLKKVTIHDYYLYDDQDSDVEDSEDQSINLIFNSAPVLEQVVIHWSRDEREGVIPGDESKAAELERKLNARPKVSANCRVSVMLF